MLVASKSDEWRKYHVFKLTVFERRGSEKIKIAKHGKPLGTIN